MIDHSGRSTKLVYKMHHNGTKGQPSLAKMELLERAAGSGAFLREHVVGQDEHGYATMAVKAIAAGLIGKSRVGQIELISDDDLKEIDEVRGSFCNGETG